MPVDPPAPTDTAPPPRDRLPFPYGDAAAAAARAAALAAEAIDWPAAAAAAAPWVEAVRAQPAPFWALESLLREYPISSAEGRALMRLAEALLRVPDVETAIALTADQLGRADFEADPAQGPGNAPNRLLAGIAANAIELSKRFLGDAEGPAGVLQRLGARTVVAATLRAIQLLGRQFVLGRSIDEALVEAHGQRRGHPTLRFSFDMLGEGARTERDAQRHLAAYARAIEAIAAGRVAASPESADGISIKLSALFARYEVAQRARVFTELLPRAAALVDAAARANLNLTVDAEECDRLELSLDLFEALTQRVAREHPGWSGFGLAVQAYQLRALPAIDEVAAIARRAPCDGGLRLMVRLVKGAYWDGEVKRAQELGLPGYPVFTRKRHTDLSYLACARALLDHHEVLYPQFATHNASTIAALLQMAARRGARFELQRLHGMGEGVAREVLARPPAGQPAPALRVYAPVGEHRDLLAYLVRRLLENGANSSFVNQLTDETVGLDTLLRSPWLPDLAEDGAAAALPLPRDLYGASRANAAGVDLACLSMRTPIEHAIAHLHLAPVAESSIADTGTAMARLQAGWPGWDATPVEARAAALQRAADRLEHDLPAWCALLVREAHKTQADALAEVREAIDFCRYYAQEAIERLADQDLPGPTGERNRLRLRGRGVFVCISPWNFPLAIFAGQVVAALVAGNAVAAKPAEQTPRVAQRFVALLHDCGVPADALALLHGAGETVGAALVADPRAAGVCFTGSTAVARLIHRSLAARDGPIVPLIAETGGLNAMIVDSTALPEQVVDAVIQSAFRSAGQRCSALRLLCLHESIADGVLEMLAGAMRELRLGDPSKLRTDIGPLIDAEAHATVLRHVARLHHDALERVRTPFAAEHAEVPNLVAPVVFEIGRIADLRDEVFGPVLHVVRWGGDVRLVVEQINALGYGLTLGIQTRIDRRAQAIADAARVGNVYVNRNMIGAVVGVQPFGGEGLSGTGPKAGGPHYLLRFCAEQTVTVNTAAAGGNADLLAGAPGLARAV